MYIRELELKEFRNYALERVKFDEMTNILIGDNGQGKTNILEACYILSLGRSFRTNIDKDMIRFDSSCCEILALVNSMGRDFKIQIRLGKEVKKAIKINEIPISNLKELLGLINIVIFSPEDLTLITGGPKERRSFVDRAISQIRPNYYSYLSDYHKFLKQRNAYLKNKEIDQDLLDVYDQALARYGFMIFKTRNEIIDKIGVFAKTYHSNISLGKEVLSLFYAPNIQASTEEEYLMVMKDRRSEDVFRGSTTKGIHRDDIDIKINDISLSAFGSQGQKRSAAISIKLSEVEMIFVEKNEYPIVLLDDIFSELDITRQESLLNTIKKTQTIITSAEEIHFDMEYNRINIDKGKIRKQEE